MIPTLDLRREGLDQELIAAFTRVLESGRYILGPEVEAFEQEMADYLGAAHAIGVSSGTDALLVALMALDVGPGDEVIVPTYTFFATAGAVSRLGATPVFVDVEEDGFNLDPSAVAARVGPRTTAIVPVHLFGRPARMAPLRSLGVPLVEDAAQSLGATIDGAPSGTLGALGCFSFFPSKNLGGFGDGGLVSTNDAALAARVRRLRAHGAEPKYVHAEIGGNFRLDTLQAALLRVKLPHLGRALARRRAHAAAYAAALEGVPGLIRPSDDPGHGWNQYVVRILDGRRAVVQRALAQRGIATAVYYPAPLHVQACFASLGHARGDFPIAERLAEETLALPIFPELTEAERAEVVTALRHALA